MRWCVTCQKMVDRPSDCIAANHDIAWEMKSPMDARHMKISALSGA